MEEIRIKAGETPDELVERIRGLANRCNFPTDAEKERHIHFRMVRALSDTDLINKLLAMKIEATTADMLAVGSHTHCNRRQHVFNGPINKSCQCSTEDDEEGINT